MLPVRTRLFLVVPFLLALAACAGAATHQSPDMTNAPGSSRENAIVLEDATNEFNGVKAEHEWVRAHMPGWSWEQQFLIHGEDGKVYDQIQLRKGGETRDIYFDITGWYGKLD
jgi:hypothetical protein